MIMGHYAVALVPFARMRRTAPFWLLLVCTQMEDFASLLLAALGIEHVTPPNFLDASFKSLHLEIHYSHVISIEILMALFTGGIVWLMWHRRDLALWCGALVLLHEACDLLSGWKHALNVGGPLVLGLDLYDTNQYLAFAVEAVFVFLLVTWYVRNQAISGGARIVLYLGFVGGMMMYVPLATHSFRQIFALFH